MKITATPTKNETSFSELKEGDVFHSYIQGRSGFFMKLREKNGEGFPTMPFLAVNMSSGALVGFAHVDNVRRKPNATMLVDGLPSEED